MATETTQAAVRSSILVEIHLVDGDLVASDVSQPERPKRGGSRMSTIDRDRTQVLETQTGYQGDQGYGQGMRPGPGTRQSAGRQRGWLDPPHADETKPFFWTSEFLTLLLAITGVAVCTAVFDNLDLVRGITLITAIAVAYIVSRGLAKAGTRHVDRGDYPGR